MKSTMKRKITVSLDADLIEKIDNLRGIIPRSPFIQELLLSTGVRERPEKSEEVGGYA